MADEDPTKKEEDRILRSMTKAGSRRPGVAGGNARPVSWNVHLSGRSVGSNVTRKAEQEEVLRALHDQIKQDEVFKVAAANEATAEQPHNKSPTPPVASPRTEIASPPLNLSLEDQAELSAANAFNEQRELERINKWTRGGGKPDPAAKKVAQTYEKPIPAVLLRQVDVEAQQHHHVHAQEKPPAEEKTEISNGHTHTNPAPQVHPDYPEGIANITKSVTIAAKALRQRNSEALVKASLSVVVSAKTLAVLVGEDAEVHSWAKALEAITNQLRTRIDSGGSGHEYYNEISNALGQLYLNLVSLS